MKIDEVIDFELGAKYMRSTMLAKLQEMKQVLPDEKANLYVVGFLDAISQLERELSEVPTK